MTQIAIIGAGAAGLIAAHTIAKKHPQSQVLLFERNKRVGRKVAISGGGRCNVTTGITDRKVLHSKYPRGADFLKFAFKAFGPEKVVEFFEDNGVPLKCEADLRVFPKSDNSEDVIGLFESAIAHTFQLSESVIDIQKASLGFKIITDKSEYIADKLIITTGGNAFAHTGSKGDGYRFATNLGHSITPLGPSLNSFEVAEQWPKQLSGISLPNIGLVSQKGRVEGAFLFTHFGISGPATFALASQIPFEKVEKHHPQAIKLDLSITLKQLNDQIQHNGRKNINTILSAKIPERLSRTILEIAKIDPSKKSADLSKLERQALASLTHCGLDLTLTRRKSGDEFVTAGGVDLTEVNPKTMESRLTPNLYFAGEILDIDGLTGGFNLQASWATGRLAGLNAGG